MTSLLRIVLCAFMPTLRARRCYRHGHALVHNGHGEHACTRCKAHWRGVKR